MLAPDSGVQKEGSRDWSVSDADPGLVDDEELAGDGFGLENGEELAEEVEDADAIEAGGAKNDDAEELGGWIGPDVGEVEIEGDESAAFVLADGRDTGIGSASEILDENVNGIVPGFVEENHENRGKVLVELELQDVLARGTTRSRASSAAYSMAARMSSSVRVG